MELPEDRLLEILRSQFTPPERDNGVAYVSTETARAGKTLRFPGVFIDVAGEALLAFIDSDPTANWGHASRYVLVDRRSGKVRSFDSQYPPFSRSSRGWRVFHKAPSVPDALLAVRPK
jgi:hypothetical protein